MKHTSDELIQKKREFGQIFFYSVAGVFLFYILLGVFTDHIVIVPIEILSLAFFFTVYTGFLISKTKFDFLVIFRILIILLAVFVIYISLLLSHISQAIFFIFVPITLAVMLLFSFRASVVSAFFSSSYLILFPKFPPNQVLHQTKNFTETDPIFWSCKSTLRISQRSIFHSLL